MILITDGTMSFSKFIYHQVHEEAQYLIGFNAGDQIHGLELARQSGSLSPSLEHTISLVYRIDGR